MMTGQPYKSPETPAAGDASATTGTTTTTKASDEGMPSPLTSPTSPTSPTTTAAGALRGVTTISAKLKRQRLANQVYKDAWMATEPTLTGSITPSELLGKVVPAVPGLVVEEADVAALVDPEDAGKGITCESSFHLVSGVSVRLLLYPGRCWTRRDDVVTLLCRWLNLWLIDPVVR